MAGTGKKKGVSLTQFAKSKGVNQSTVSRAIESGRLNKSVKKTKNGRVELDPDLAEEEFDTNRLRAASIASRIGKEDTVDLDDPESGDPDNPAKIFRYETKLKRWQAEKARLQAEAVAGTLIPIEDTERHWVSVASIARTRVMGIASRARQRIPEMTNEQYEILKAVVRESLEGLADESSSEDP